MKIQVERNDACEAILTIEPDDATVETAKHKAAKSISEKANLPGFRRGKAPYHVVLNAVGEEALLEEAIDTLSPELYRQALESEHLTPCAVGKLEEIVSKTPLTLKFIVPLQPVVNPGEYRATRLPYETPVVADDEVEKAMEELRVANSVLAPVERPAQKGDVLVAHVESSVRMPDGNTEPLHFEGQEDPDDYDLDDNLGGRFPGAGPALEGIAEGETRATEITYPESFPIERLRNLKVQLVVKCLGVKVRQLPDWNEELIKTISEFSTVEELRTNIRTRMESYANQAKEDEYADQVLGKMVEGGQVKYPPALLEEEIEEEVEDFRHRLEDRKMSLDVYLRTIPDGMAGLKKRMEEAVCQRMVRNLFLAEFIKQEKLEVSDEEVEKEYQEYLQKRESTPTRKTKRTEQADQALRRTIGNGLLSQHIMERLAAIGQGIAPAPVKDPENNG
jgi:trigger factor